MRRLASCVILLGIVLGAPALAQTPAAPPAEANPADALERAFQKEYAYLVAERASLAERVENFERAAERRRAEAEQVLDATQRELLDLQQRGAEAQQRLQAAQVARSSIVEGVGAVDAALSQSGTTLGLAVPAPEAPLAERIAALELAFTEAVARVARDRSVRRERGPVFLADGREVEADVLRIGQIAAFAVSEGEAGALLPGGNGRLQVFGSSEPAHARSLATGIAPDTVGVFLFESADKRVDPPKTKTFDDQLVAGGSVGYVILGLGGVLALMALVRLITILRCQGGSPAVAEAVALALRAGRFDDAAQRAAKIGGSMGRVLQEITAGAHLGREELEVLAEQRIEREMNLLGRFGSALLVGASVAPLLGLLGTVSGMISTFDIITEYGTGNPKLLSGGISEALVTTEFGLIVAIPGVLIGNMLNGMSRGIAATAESAAILALHHLGRGAGAAAGGGGGPSASDDEATEQGVVELGETGRAHVLPA